MAIDLQSRSETEDCPFCKEPLVPPVTRCPECQVGLHVACAQESTRSCPTLGCARNVVPAATAESPLAAGRRQRRQADYRRLAVLGLLLVCGLLGWWRFAYAEGEVARITSTPHRFPIGELAWVDSNALAAADVEGGLAVYDVQRERLAWVQDDLESKHDELRFLNTLEPGVAVVGCSGSADLVRWDGSSWRGHFVDPTFQHFFDARSPTGKSEWSDFDLLLVPAGGEVLELRRGVGFEKEFYGSITDVRGACLTGLDDQVLVGSKSGLFVSSAQGLMQLSNLEVKALVPAAGLERGHFAVVYRNLIELWSRHGSELHAQGALRIVNVQKVALDATGRVLALARSGRIEVKGLYREPLARFPTRSTVTALEFRPDGRFLASAEGDVIRVWELP